MELRVVTSNLHVATHIPPTPTPYGDAHTRTIAHPAAAHNSSTARGIPCRRHPLPCCSYFAACHQHLGERCARGTDQPGPLCCLPPCPPAAIDAAPAAASPRCAQSSRAPPHTLAPHAWRQHQRWPSYCLGLSSPACPPHSSLHRTLAPISRTGHSGSPGLPLSVPPLPPTPTSLITDQQATPAPPKKGIYGKALHLPFWVLRHVDRITSSLPSS